MKALIAIGGTKTHRFRGRLYRRTATWYRGSFAVEWQESHWNGWRQTDDRMAMRLEQDFRLARMEEARQVATHEVRYV